MEPAGARTPDKHKYHGHHLHNIHAVMNLARDHGSDDEAWSRIFAALTEIQRDNVNTVNERAGRNYALLHHAAYHLKMKACQTLLNDFGADPSITTRGGKLASTVAEGDDALVSYLKTEQNTCEKALHEMMDLAKGSGDQKEAWVAIYAFLDNRCVVNQLLTRTYNLLHHAAFWKNTHACNTLLARFGADPTLLDKNGNTAQQIAESQGAMDTAKLIAKFASEFVPVPEAVKGHSSSRHGGNARLSRLPSVAAYEPSTICSAEGDFALYIQVQKTHVTLTGKVMYVMEPSTDKGVTGKYTFDSASRKVSAGGDVVGTFLEAPAASKPWSPEALNKIEAHLPLKCVRVVSSEIMEEIQNAKNDNAFFVLPSQLNGAEYPSQEAIVKRIEQYKKDHTGGPRGQLSVHPAAGQFILDNASNELNLDGVDATDSWLEKAREMMKSNEAKEYGISLQNGYLTIPPCPPELWADVLGGLTASLHNLRILGMDGVPASGLAPSFEELSSATHRVSLFYASAVPIDSYQNGMDRKLPPGWERFISKDKYYFYMYQKDSNTAQWEHPNEEAHEKQLELQTEIGRLNLIAQYYGALKTALQRSRIKPAKIFLMPLGGGVFCNPMEIIIGAMSHAIELLHGEGIDVTKDIDINVLAWKGSHSEAHKLSVGLEKCGKLSKGFLDPPPKPVHQSSW